jgi:predicted nucleotidyltransferase
MSPTNPADDPRLREAIAAHPYPLLFATISGAHLYGFPSADSDYDLRGVHLLPPEKLLGLEASDETLDRSRIIGGLEVDLVTHDARKFFRLMLKKNGYVLEQVFSPLVVHAMTPQFDALREIARRCVTRHHAYHYNGFARNQWELFDKERPRRVKPLLYVYRVLFTGIHLMRSGEVEANLVTLNANEFRLPHVDELVARKRAGAEQATLDDGDVTFHEGEFARLLAELATASERSPLPEQPAGRADLNALLLALRGVESA